MNPEYMSMKEKHDHISAFMEVLKQSAIQKHEELGIKVKSLRWEIEY
jgi:hypothetical protein